MAPQHGRTRGLHAPVLVKPTDQPPTRRAINGQAYEADAFWTWAIIEVLRLTGIRLEELLELTHLSICHYRLAGGELVVLLQVAPSKTDRERVIPVCPELAHVLAMVVARARGHQPSVPLVERYDHYERVTSVPLPYLFQRSPNGTPVVIGHQGARDAITRAVARAKLHDVNGQPLRLVPHDFRRLFATEAVNGGLPIHIAAKLLGHLDLNTTKGYVAVYPDQVIHHLQTHLARRRASRPGQEYREPTTQEWDGFQQHFRRRRMALGDCYRPTAPTVRTSTPACAARCCAWTPTSSRGCCRSSTTPTGCSPRHSTMAGKERRPDSRTPWATSPTRRPRSTASRPARRARQPRCG